MPAGSFLILRRMSLSKVIGALVLVAVLAGAAYLVTSLFVDEDPLGGFTSGREWQAVILGNDRVYFGRLTVVNEDFFRLDDAYFLREQTEQGADPVRQVVSLQAELHNPEDSMLIDRDDILVIENLASDSPVVDTIEGLQESEASN